MAGLGPRSKVQTESNRRARWRRGFLLRFGRRKTSENKDARAMKTPRPKFIAIGNQTPGQFIAGLYRRAAHILRTGKRLPPLKNPSIKQK
jgi:hypothetical protein